VQKKKPRILRNPEHSKAKKPALVLFGHPNPDKPEPKLTAKTKKEKKKIEFGTQELTKVKTIIS